MRAVAERKLNSWTMTTDTASRVLFILFFRCFLREETWWSGRGDVGYIENTFFYYSQNTFFWSGDRIINLVGKVAGVWME